MSFDPIRGRVPNRIVYIDNDDELTVKSTTGSGDVVLSSSPTLTGTISAAAMSMSSTLTLAADPMSALQAATKQYVDSVATGLDVKASVRVATTADITLSGEQTIDGVSIVNGNRVLVKDQTDSEDNGIYICSTGAWTRSTDADNSPAGEVTSGMFTFVSEGTANEGQGFVLVTPDPIVLGTTGLDFSQFSGSASITAGNGLDTSGNIWFVGTASASRIVVNANDIDLATTGVSAGTYTKLTVDVYGRVTTATSLSSSDVTTALGYTPVNRAGDTMTGALALPSNGLTIGTTQLVSAGGNILIGTATDNTVHRLQVDNGFHVARGDSKVFLGPDKVFTVFGAGTGTGEGGIIALGRSSGIDPFTADAFIAVPGAAASYAMIAAAGDLVLRTANSMILTAKNATGHLKFATGGSDVEKMRLVNAGRLVLGSSITDDGVHMLQVKSGGFHVTSGDSRAFLGADKIFTVFGAGTGSTEGGIISIGRAASNDPFSGLGFIAVPANASAYSNIATASDLIVRANNNLILTSRGSSHIKFSTGGTDTEKMRLVNAGRLLIGTTTDDSTNLLQVNGGILSTSINVTGGSVSNVGSVPVWYKFTVSHTALQAAATTNNITLLTLPAGGVIHSVKIKHSTAFSGTGITSYTVSVGITGNLTKYSTAFNVFQSVANTTFSLTDALGSEDHGASALIKIAATSGGANLDQSSAGSVDIWVLVSKAI